MMTLLTTGVIEIIDTTKESKSQQYHLSYHPIVTPGVKILLNFRIVYNTSCKAERELNSLNDYLFRGPVILPDLCGLLVSFGYTQ